MGHPRKIVVTHEEFLLLGQFLFIFHPQVCNWDNSCLFLFQFFEAFQILKVETASCFSTQIDNSKLCTMASL